MFPQLLINSLIAGAIYSLIASGFSLIYSTNKFIHFAHGGVIVFSAYVLHWLYSQLGFDFYLSAIFTVLFSAFLGYFINLFFYKPLRKRKASTAILLIASIAVMTLLESVVILFWGSDVKTINFFQQSAKIDFLNATIAPLQIFIIIISMALFISFSIFMKKTKIGKAMRAISDNKETAEIIGISSNKIYGFSFVIGSAVAGIGAILIALEQNIVPTMGASLMIKGFTAAVIGGIGSVPGSILGAFLLGSAENFGIWFLPSGYKDAIAFVLLFIFLLLRPRGILGIKNSSIK